MITSTSNSSIKNIRRLVREKKSRLENDQFYLEGLRIVGEALRQGAPLNLLVFSPELLISAYGKTLVEQAVKQGCDTLAVSAEVFRSFSLKDGPQGIAAVAPQRWTAMEKIKPGSDDLWAAVYQPADPGNLGTILRTMDAVGGRGVIVLESAADPFDPVAVRASMGAVFTQTLTRGTLDEFFGWKQQHTLPVIGTSDAAEADYHGYPYPKPLVLLLGSEREGLPAAYQQMCEALVRIPMMGGCDSLNLSVAAGVVLYEIFNQRREYAAGREAEA